MQRSEGPGRSNAVQKRNINFVSGCLKYRGHESLKIEAVGCFNIGGHEGCGATEAFSKRDDFIIVSASKGARPTGRNQHA
jgi:hypothetical protein